MLKQLYIQGITAYTQGKSQQAAQHLASYVAKSGHHIDAWKILGICYFDLGNYPKAIQAFEKTLQLQAKDDETWFNLGLCYLKNNNWLEAIRCYTACVQHNPQHWKAHTSLADAHKALNQIDEAITHYMAAIQIRGLNASDLLFKLSQVLLLKGAWQEGFELFEHRIALDTAAREHASIPRWQGQEVKGKRILVECEQGFGDSIQFSRYLPLLHNAGAQVLLACPEPLQALFQNAFPQIQVLSPGAQIAQASVNYYTPLMSLAGLFTTTPDHVPFPQPYLSAPEASRKKWEWISHTEGLKVGLVWSGNPAHKNDKNRSINLAPLMAALPTGVTYFSIQKDDKACPPPRLTSLTNDIQNFADTAAICEQMDVVITVDTSIAHLSGALGTPTWVMLPFSPDWRWLLNRDDSVWYDSVTLFRQHHIGDWSSVFSAIAQQLPIQKVP